LADLTGIQIGQATSAIYKEAFGDRVHLSNLNDLLLQDNRYGKSLSQNSENAGDFWDVHCFVFAQDVATFWTSVRNLSHELGVEVLISVYYSGERTGKGYYNYKKGSRVEQPAPELDSYLAKTRQASSLIPNGKVTPLNPTSHCMCLNLTLLSTVFVFWFINLFYAGPPGG